MQLVATHAFSFVLIVFFVVNILRLASRFRFRSLEGKERMLPRRATKPILSLGPFQGQEVDHRAAAV